MYISQTAYILLYNSGKYIPCFLIIIFFSNYIIFYHLIHKHSKFCCVLHWLRKKALLFPKSLTYIKDLIEFDVSNNTLDNFTVVSDKSAAQTKQMSFAVKDKDISCLECHHRQEIASTGLKQGFQEGKGNGFLTNYIL